MTLIRGGEERDLAAIVAMGRVRATHFGSISIETSTSCSTAITKKRLLAGLGPPGRVSCISSSLRKASPLLLMSSSASSEAHGRSRSAATVIPLVRESAPFYKRSSHVNPSSAARRSAPGSLGACPSTGHDCVGEALDRRADDAVARIDGDAAAAVWRRCALLAWRHLLSRHPSVHARGLFASVTRTTASRLRRCRCRGRRCGSRTSRASWPTRMRFSSPEDSTARTSCTTAYGSTARCALRHTYITTPATSRRSSGLCATSDELPWHNLRDDHPRCAL